MKKFFEEPKLSSEKIREIELDIWSRFGLNIDVFDNGDWKTHTNVDGSCIYPKKNQSDYIDKLIKKNIDNPLS